MLKIIMKFIFNIAVMIMALSLVGCGGEFSDVVDNYQDFIDDLQQYEKIDIDDAVDDDDEKTGDLFERVENTSIYVSSSREFDGIKNLYAYAFDEATPFIGDYAIIKINGIEFLIDKNGELINLSTILSKNKITLPDIISAYFDKIIIQKDNCFGLVDFSGNSILSITYDNITIFGNIVVAKQGAVTHIYRDNTLLASVDCSVDYVDEKVYIKTDGSYCNIETSENIIIEGASPMFVPKDGFVVVKKDKLYGIAEYPSMNIVIEPNYFFCRNVGNGYCMIYEFSLKYSKYGVYYDYPKLLRISDNAVVYDFADVEEATTCAMLPNAFEFVDGNTNYFLGKFINSSIGYRSFYIDVNTSKLHCLDIDFAQNKLFNHYVQDIAGNLYDVSCGGKLVSDLLFDEIEMAGNKFIVKYNGAYRLLDEKFEVIVESCQDISYRFGVFLIKVDNKYAYYV